MSSHTVKAGRNRCIRQAVRNVRYNFHGFHPPTQPEVARSLWVYRNPSGAVARVKGYRLDA